MEKKIKLTPKQKEAIKLLREGWHYGSNCDVLFRRHKGVVVERKNISYIMVGKKLGDMRLIDSDFSLTQLGQTIEI